MPNLTRTVRILILSSCFFFLGCTEKNSDLVKYKVGIPNTNFEWEFSRFFTNSVSFIDSFDYEEGYLIQPKSFNNKIYGIEKSSWKIMELNKDNGIIENRYGKVGNGNIDENQNFFHYFFDENYYFIYDIGRSIMKKYNKNSELQEYKTFKFFSNAVTKGQGDNFYFVADNEIGDDLLFYHFDFKSGNVIVKDSLSHILKIAKDETIEVIYDGQLVYGNNHVVYYFNKVGLLLVFDNNFELIGEISTIDKTPAPKMSYLSSEDDTYLMTDPPYTIFTYCEIINDKIYLLNALSNQSHRCIDIYSIENLNYSGSMKLRALVDTQLPKSFTFIDDEELTVVYEDMTIVKYKVN